MTAYMAFAAMGLFLLFGIGVLLSQIVSILKRLEKRERSFYRPMLLAVDNKLQQIISKP
jgi:hypothetical protein